MMRKNQVIFCIFLIIALKGCQKNNVPEVIRTVGKETTVLPLTLRSFIGVRDGYDAEGEIIFAGPSSGPAPQDSTLPDSLILHIKVETGIPARFISGRYSLIAPKVRFRGSFKADALSFFGGQGGLPSLGGKFSFATEFGEKYEIRLPPTEIQKP